MTVKGQLQAVQLHAVFTHSPHLLEERLREGANLELCVLGLIYKHKSRHFEPKKESLTLNSRPLSPHAVLLKTWASRVLLSFQK